MRASQPHIEHFKIGSGKVIAAKADNREDRNADACQGRETPRPESLETDPKPFQLVAACHYPLESESKGIVRG